MVTNQIMMPKDWQEVHFFKESEFSFKCGCGFNVMKKEFILLLDIAREKAKTPFKINCGCRCSAHNKNVGGVQDSAHIKGLAVDIHAEDNTARFKIVSALLAVGFKRVLIYGTFVHVDDDLTKDYPILNLM